MIDHYGINVTDLAATARFYDAVLGVLGFTRQMDFGEAIGYGTDGHPDFWISASAQGASNREAHIAFTAQNRAAVEAFFKTATQLGAPILHAPSEWPEYHDGYYAAFVRDPDGNNVEAVFHH